MQLPLRFGGGEKGRHPLTPKRSECWGVLMSRVRSASAICGNAVTLSQRRFGLRVLDERGPSGSGDPGGPFLSAYERLTSFGRVQMSDPVQLKNFDKLYKSAVALNDKVGSRFTMEFARPKVWTKSQLDDLGNLLDAVTNIINAVGEMAARVRDD